MRTLVLRLVTTLIGVGMVALAGGASLNGF
jgi:hypothetical protein